MVTQEQAKGTSTSQRPCHKGLMNLREKYHRGGELG